MKIPNRRPETPLLDAIKFAERSYTTDSLLRMHNDIMDRALKGSTEFVYVEGRPGIGKSMLLGEVLKSAVHRLKDAGLQNSEVKQVISHVPFEDAQHIVNDRGFLRNDHENSKETVLHYRETNQFLLNTLHALIRDRSIIYVEIPGMIRRGEITFETVALRLNAFADDPYHVSCVFLTNGTGVIERSARIRSEFQDSPERKREALEKENVIVHGESRNIGGGIFEAVQRYYASERQYLYFLVKNQGITNDFFSKRITSPVSFEDLSLRSAYLEQVYAPWYNGEKLHLPRQSIFVSRNDEVAGQLHLYQDELDAHNVFLRK